MWEIRAMRELLAIDGASWSDYPCDIRTYRRVWRDFFTRTFGLWALHLCNQGFCWEPYHVYLGTPEDNALDSKMAGTQYFGSPRHVQYMAGKKLNRGRRFCPYTQQMEVLLDRLREATSREEEVAIQKRWIEEVTA